MDESKLVYHFLDDWFKPYKNLFNLKTSMTHPLSLTPLAALCKFACLDYCE